MLSHKQEMERPHSESKQHQTENRRTRSMHNKALQTKDSASMCCASTTPYSEVDINSFYNDGDETR